jgi:hypothetical protein
MADRTTSTDPDHDAGLDHDSGSDRRRAAPDGAARPDPGPAPPGQGVRSEVEPSSRDEVRRAAAQVERLEGHHRPMDDDAGIVPDRRQDSSGTPDRGAPDERS